MNISELSFRQINELINSTEEDITLDGCVGERFIGVGAKGKTITINGIAGNALGAYLDGATIVLNQNGQDAVGDTMNDGKIVINGSTGDALGYAMRGGEIYVKGDSGYRTGIHMKEYEGKKPVIVVGGSAGSFLGEYLAGGLIIVLGLTYSTSVVGNFTGTGMHGGEIFVRTSHMPKLPEQVDCKKATKEDLETIGKYVEEYTSLFGGSKDDILDSDFYVLRANSKNPYERLYTIH